MAFDYAYQAAIADLVTGEPAPVRKAGPRTVMPVRLAPFGVAAFRVSGAGVQIVGWEAAPADRDDLAHVRGEIETALQLLGDEDAGGRISAKDSSWLAQAARQAAADLDEGREARAWSVVTDWRYWTLLHDELLQDYKR